MSTHTDTVHISGIPRRSYQAIALLYLCALLGCIAMVLGPAINDYKIERHSGRALATVTDVSRTRTTVEFQDQNGKSQAPKTGLLYPTGLGVGQKVWVQYDTENPDLVKVEGRKWTLSVIPALSILAVSTLITILLWLLVGYIVSR